MKKYFLQFDFWGKGVNKFLHTIITANLVEDDINDICRHLISENFDFADPYVFEIRICALNNIEV